MRKLLVILPWFVLSVSCAHTSSLPQELVDARYSYNRAVQGSGVELAPAQLHVARNSLHRAEKAFIEHPQARETRDLAYIAQRKAQLAESISGIELAKAQRQRAEKAVNEERERLTLQAQNEAKMREQLVRETLATREALTKLSRLKNGVREDSRGLVVTLPGQGLFVTGKATLLSGGRSQLDELARALSGARAQSITVEGYTDASGSQDGNERLSEARAQAVLDYLARRGVPPDRLQAVGHGAQNPVASNRTTEGRAANRRVEVVVQTEAAATR